ncbi:putative ribonuclease H-like domain-containing protein [Tanacetum coccineum]
MEFESAQSNTTAKLPIVKLGEYEMWVIRIKQYFQMNKADIETISIDDLYNNFKIVEQDVKKSVGASSGAQNLAFMTAPSTSITNDVNTANPAYEVSTVSPNINTACPQVSTANFSDNTVYAFMVENPNGSNLLQQDLEKIYEDDLEAMNLKWQLSLLSIRAKRYFQRTGKKIFINVNDTAGYDKSKVECFNCHKMGHFAREYRAPRNKEGFDWIDMAEEQVQTNMALMAFSDSEIYNDKTFTKTCLKIMIFFKKQFDDLIVKLNQNKFIAATFKRGLTTIEEQLVTYRKNEVLFSEEVAVLKREVACKNYEINVLKTEFEKVKQEKEGIEFKIEKFNNASKILDKLLGSQITNKSKKGLGYNVVPPPHPLIYNRPKKLDLSYSSLDEFKNPKFKISGSKDSKLVSNIVCDKKSYDSKENSDESLVKEQVSKDQINCNYHQREMMVSRNNYNRVDYDYYAKTTHPSAHRNMTQRAVLLKTGLTPLNTIRHVNTAHPKLAVHSAKSMSHFSKQAQLTNQRPFYKKTILISRYVNRKLNTAMRHYHTESPKAVNTARSCTTPVNAVRAKRVNAVKTSACWVWRPTRPNGASLVFKRHNYIDARDFKEFDGGYVTFGGGAHGGRISGKGTLKTDSLDFEDVYFVNELNFNLFSVSQMCDKKNYVLFTNTECLVLSPNFKLPDESQILLKIPRKDNMYSFDMKNIVPKESLTCLVAKATLDESMLWHRRLGHINFKNINKLVKDNLVRGLPIKHFENDQTCVACLKGKQHRASCKSKVLNPITKPLFMLHMDLFGPTFVSSLMHKKYCLVVTDDYSRFTWVFFLATKDETSEILKNFIKEIENLVDKKVKIIRCDNGTEFKNKVMDDFCREKGIRREYSPGLLSKMLSKLVLLAMYRIGNLMKSDEGFPIVDIPPLSSKALSGYTTTRTRKEEISQDCIVMPIWKDASYFDSPSKDVGNGEPKSAADDQKQVKDGPHNESDEKDKYEDDSSPKEVNAAGQHVNTASPESLLQVLTGHRQEGIDYEEVFALVARIEAIRLFLANASIMGFLVYQMDVKSAFLYGTIEEEVIYSTTRKKDPDHPDNVTQKEDGIFISQDKYVAEILKKFNYTDVKSASTPIDLEKPLVKDGDADDVDISKGKPTLGLWYSRDSPFELVAYTDSDYARATQDRKSTTGGLLFEGRLLMSICSQAWMEGHVTSKVGDEAVHKELGDIMERAATTASSLEAKQDSDAQTRFEVASKQSNDPPLSRVNALGSGEDSMKLIEFMANCTTLSELVRKRIERFCEKKRVV